MSGTNARSPPVGCREQSTASWFTLLVRQDCVSVGDPASWDSVVIRADVPGKILHLMSQSHNGIWLRAFGPFFRPPHWVGGQRRMAI